MTARSEMNGSGKMVVSVSIMLGVLAAVLVPVHNTLADIREDNTQALMTHGKMIDQRMEGIEKSLNKLEGILEGHMDGHPDRVVDLFERLEERVSVNASRLADHDNTYGHKGVSQDMARVQVKEMEVETQFKGLKNLVFTHINWLREATGKPQTDIPVIGLEKTVP